MNALKALEILHQNKLIDAVDSSDNLVRMIREAAPEPELVGAVLGAITGKKSYEEEYISRGDAEKERKIFNLYLLNYLAVGCIRDRGAESQTQFNRIYKEAVDKAIYQTTERLYGENTWLDATERADGIKVSKPTTRAEKPALKAVRQKETKMSEDTKILPTAEGNPVVAKGKKVTATGKKPSKVVAIRARIVELYDKEQKSREETITTVMGEFGLTARNTTLTYFNEAVRMAGIAKRKE